MKLQCIKEKIRDAVSVAERVTNKNLSLPVLGSVILSADKNYLKITATNLDLGVEIKIPAKIEKTGVVAVPGTILGHFLSNITDETVFFTENALFFTATDSFRLAEKKIQSTNKGETTTLLIPYKNALEIAKILETVQGDVEVLFNKNQISFKYDSCYVTSRLIDGVFPDYKQIIPKNFKTEVIVLKHDFLNSLKI